MNTQTLKTLIAIARIGSFAKTAEELNSTLSTVSMQMKSLEEQLGCQLFDRSFRPPLLSPLGRKVARQARKVIEEEAKLMNVCKVEGELSGHYRLGFVATASVRLLPSFLKNARKRAPNSDFQIETGLSEILETRVQSGQLEAAVVTASENALPGLRYTELRKEPLVYAIPRLFQEKPWTFLAENSLFLQFNPGSGIGKLIENHVHEHLPPLVQTVVLDSVEAIMECVNQGLGFTLLADADARRYGKPETIIRPPEIGNPHRTLALVSKAQKDSNHIDQAIANLFKN